MKKAFTLIEMVIVIVMLGILAAIFVPSQESYIGAARGVQVDSVQKNFLTSINAQQNFFLGDPSKERKVQNDFGNEVELFFEGTAPTLSGYDLNNTGQVALDEAGCIALFKVLGNVDDDKINSSAWEVTFNANICTFKFLPTSTGFTYDNTNGTVTDVDTL